MKNCLSFAAIVVIFSPALSHAGQEKAGNQQQTEKIDKKVLEIVKQTGDLYKNAKAMHAEAVFVTAGAGEGAKKELKVTGIYEIERPNHLSLKTQVAGDPKKGPDVVADGKNLVVYRKALNQYVEEESPQGLADIGLALLGLGAPSAGMLLANILADDPADLLMQGVTECSYVGRDKVNDTPAHRLKFKQPEFDWELWVAAEGKPYILRMVSTREGDNGKVTTTETYKNWKIDAAPPKDTFKFVAPNDAKKVKEFGDGPR